MGSPGPGSEATFLAAIRSSMPGLGVLPKSCLCTLVGRLAQLVVTGISVQHFIGDRKILFRLER